MAGLCKILDHTCTYLVYIAFVTGCHNGKQGTVLSHQSNTKSGPLYHTSLGCIFIPNQHKTTIIQIHSVPVTININTRRGQTGVTEFSPYKIFSESQCITVYFQEATLCNIMSKVLLNSVCSYALCQSDGLKATSTFLCVEICLQRSCIYQLIYIK